MTSQFDFTNDEWDHLATTPLLVGVAVAKAEDSGFIGSRRETRTLMAAIATEATENPARSLIDQAATTDTDEAYEGYQSLEPDVLADDAVAACGQLVEILSRVATPDEATGYAQWVLDVAHRVADAAKEEGVRVSPGEAALIERVTGVLRP